MGLEAVILAGGRGVGLEPITHTRPKALIPILNQKLIDLHIIRLTRASIRKYVVVINYMGDLIKERLSKLSNELGIDIEFVDQGSPLGTGHALLKAMPYVKANEFLVVYCDVYFKSDEWLKEFIERSGNVIAVTRVKDPSRYGVVVVNEDRVINVVEKPKTFITDHVNAGIYKFSSKYAITKFLETLSVSERGEYELTSAIQLMIERGIDFKYMLIRDWLDVGRPWNVIEANKMTLDSLSSKDIRGEVEDNVIIKGPLILEEGAKIRSGSYLVGPIYVGRNVEVGPNAYIRPYSVILDNSKIGFNVEIKESVVMEGTHISHQAYVGDSVVCEGVNLGAGTILANLRFDEKNVKVRVKDVVEDSGRRKLGAFIGGHVRTGVNVSVFPGVKIGAYSWIYPGVVVTEDVPPRSILKHGGVVVRRLDM